MNAASDIPSKLLIRLPPTPLTIALAWPPWVDAATGSGVVERNHLSLLARCLSWPVQALNLFNNLGIRNPESQAGCLDPRVKVPLVPPRVEGSR